MWVKHKVKDEDNKYEKWKIGHGARKKKYWTTTPFRKMIFELTEIISNNNKLKSS